MRLNIYKLILYFLNLLKNIYKKSHPSYTRSLEFQVDQKGHTDLTGSITSPGFYNLKPD